MASGGMMKKMRDNYYFRLFRILGFNLTLGTFMLSEVFIINQIKWSMTIIIIFVVVEGIKQDLDRWEKNLVKAKEQKDGN